MASFFHPSLWNRFQNFQVDFFVFEFFFLKQQTTLSCFVKRCEWQFDLTISSSSLKWILERSDQRPKIKLCGGRWELWWWWENENEERDEVLCVNCQYIAIYRESEDWWNCTIFVDKSFQCSWYKFESFKAIPGKREIFHFLLCTFFSSDPTQPDPFQLIPNSP